MRISSLARALRADIRTQFCNSFEVIEISRPKCLPTLDLTQFPDYAVVDPKMNDKLQEVFIDIDGGWPDRLIGYYNTKIPIMLFHCRECEVVVQDGYMTYINAAKITDESYPDVYQELEPRLLEIRTRHREDYRDAVNNLSDQDDRDSIRHLFSYPDKWKELFSRYRKLPIDPLPDDTRVTTYLAGTVSPLCLRSVQRLVDDYRSRLKTQEEQLSCAKLEHTFQKEYLSCNPQTVSQMCATLDQMIKNKEMVYKYETSNLHSLDRAKMSIWMEPIILALPEYDEEEAINPRYTGDRNEYGDRTPRIHPAGLYKFPPVKVVSPIYRNLDYDTKILDANTGNSYPHPHAQLSCWQENRNNAPVLTGAGLRLTFLRSLFWKYDIAKFCSLIRSYISSSYDGYTALQSYGELIEEIPVTLDDAPAVAHV